MDTKLNAATIVDLLDDNPPPGFALGIVSADETVFEMYQGVANFAKHMSVSADVVFRIGSISKTFTAIAVLQLWEKGDFALDDPINRHLKSIRIHPPTPDAPPITIHHLLTHTSGLGRGETFREFLEAYGHFSGRWEPRFDSLNAFYGADGLHPAVPAGIKYSYSNNGYAILGQLVEDISGQPFAEYVRQHIFDRLGMTHSDVVFSNRTRPTLAMGYRGRAGDYVAIRPTEILQQGAGAMLSSLRDMMIFARALLQQDDRILQPESWRQMLHPHWQLDPHLWMQAYGCECQNLDGHLVYNQSGGAGGFNANLAFSPDHQLALVALSNRNLTVETVIITRQLLLQILEVQDPVLQDNPQVDIADWQDLTGYYQPSAGWKTNIDFYTDVGIGGIHVYIEDHQLLFRADFGKAFRLHPDMHDPLLFYAELPAPRPFIFRRSDAAQVNQVLFNRFCLYKVPISRSSKYRLKRIGWSILLALIFIFIMRRRSV